VVDTAGVLAAVSVDVLVVGWNMSLLGTAVAAGAASKSSKFVCCGVGTGCAGSCAGFDCCGGAGLLFTCIPPNMLVDGGGGGGGADVGAGGS
jgi:hypothetical protein